ncbi:Hpt domain-containing protein [Marinobacter hydrocarbonoclasticus]|nr:Hpt domain-containing protein [Marinobacter nauticus]
MELMTDTVLKQMAEDVGEETLPAILSIFIEELSEMAAQLTVTSDAEIGDLAHRIKGSANTFGASALAKAAAGLELQAKRGEPCAQSSDVRSLARLAEQTVSHYQDYLNTRCAKPNQSL